MKIFIVAFLRLEKVLAEIWGIFQQVFVTFPVSNPIYHSGDSQGLKGLLAKLICFQP